MLTILLLTGIIAYIIIASRIYNHVRKRTDRKLIRFLTLFALIFFAIGDNILNGAVFYYLCKTHGGKKIYKTVDNVDGFFVENFNNGLFPLKTIMFDGSYKFVEAKVKQPSKESFTDSPGLYIYKLSTPDDNKCKLYNEWESNVEKNKVNFYDIFTSRDECISSNKIDKINSIYSVSTYYQKNYIPLLFISCMRTEIKNISTGEILGRANRFSYSGGWVINLFFSGMGSTKACPKSTSTIEEPSIHRSIVYEVLKPTKQ